MGFTEGFYVTFVFSFNIVPQRLFLTFMILKFKKKRNNIPSNI